MSISKKNNTDFIGAFGKILIALVADIGRLTQLLLRSGNAVFRNTIFWKNTLIEMESIGVRSMPIVLIISVFTGMVFSLQIAKIFAAFGLSSQLGQGLTLAFARELGPVLVGVVVAGRVGSSIAAEIGSMKVTEQIDALETLSTDPVDYLVAPRIVAGCLMLPILVTFADLIGIAGGFAVAVFYAHIPFSNFVDGILTFVTFWDFMGGIIKSFFFGLAITLIATYKGLVTENGAVGVGKATTESVVHSTIVIFILNYFLSMFLYQL